MIQSRLKSISLKVKVLNVRSYLVLDSSLSFDEPITSICQRQNNFWEQLYGVTPCMWVHKKHNFSLNLVIALLLGYTTVLEIIAWYISFTRDVHVSFQELLKKDNSISFRIRNIQLLVISSFIVREIFKKKDTKNLNSRKFLTLQVQW